MNYKVKFIKITLGLFIILSITSCNSFWLKYSGVLDEKTELKVISNGQKNIAYLPLHHIGRKEYYDDMSKKIDSLQNLNYIVFYEMVTTDLKDSLEYIDYAKKFRKIQGGFGAGNGYLDTINNKIYGNIKYDEKYKMRNQPKFFEIGVDSLSAINADVKLEELISAFEKRNGTIKLNECDLKTGLKSEYTCETLNKKLKKDFKKNFTLGMRNENLAELITNSNSNKIFVIYGARHFRGMLKELKSIDENWKEKR